MLLSLLLAFLAFEYILSVYRYRYLKLGFRLLFSLPLFRLFRLKEASAYTRIVERFKASPSFSFSSFLKSLAEADNNPFLGSIARTGISNFHQLASLSTYIGGIYHLELSHHNHYTVNRTSSTLYITQDYPGAVLASHEALLLCGSIGHGYGHISFTDSLSGQFASSLSLRLRQSVNLSVYTLPASTISHYDDYISSISDSIDKFDSITVLFGWNEYDQECSSSMPFGKYSSVLTTKRVLVSNLLSRLLTVSLIFYSYVYVSSHILFKRSKSVNTNYSLY